MVPRTGYTFSQDPTAKPESQAFTTKRIRGDRTGFLHYTSQNALATMAPKLAVDMASKDSTYSGWTPLSWAAINGDEAVVKLLLETGKVDVDSKD